MLEMLLEFELVATLVLVTAGTLLLKAFLVHDLAATENNVVRRGSTISAVVGVAEITAAWHSGVAFSVSFWFKHRMFEYLCDIKPNLARTRKSVLSFDRHSQ